jgi:hypothetical protein
MADLFYFRQVKIGFGTIGKMAKTKPTDVELKEAVEPIIEELAGVITRERQKAGEYVVGVSMSANLEEIERLLLDPTKENRQLISEICQVVLDSFNVV